MSEEQSDPAVAEAFIARGMKVLLAAIDAPKLRDVRPSLPLPRPTRSVGPRVNPTLDLGS